MKTEPYQFQIRKNYFINRTMKEVETYYSTIKFREPFDTINNSLPVNAKFSYGEYYFFFDKTTNQGFWGLLNRTQVSRLVSELRCAPISKQFVAVYIKLTNPNESPYYTNIKVTSQVVTNYTIFLTVKNWVYIKR